EVEVGVAFGLFGDALIVDDAFGVDLGLGCDEQDPHDNRQAGEDGDDHIHPVRVLPQEAHLFPRTGQHHSGLVSHGLSLGGRRRVIDDRSGPRLVGGISDIHIAIVLVSRAKSQSPCRRWSRTQTDAAVATLITGVAQLDARVTPKSLWTRNLTMTEDESMRRLPPSL